MDKRVIGKPCHILSIVKSEDGKHTNVTFMLNEQTTEISVTLKKTLKLEVGPAVFGGIDFAYPFINCSLEVFNMLIDNEHELFLSKNNRLLVNNVPVKVAPSVYLLPQFVLASKQEYMLDKIYPTRIDGRGTEVPTITIRDLDDSAIANIFFDLLVLRKI